MDLLFELTEASGKRGGMRGFVDDSERGSHQARVGPREEERGSQAGRALGLPDVATLGTLSGALVDARPRA